jgi:hypothetical protein
MSLGWSKQSSIYSNVQSTVQTQLNTRKEIVNKSKRTDSDLLFLNSNTGWVKLSSGVDVANKDNTFQASQNILFGGTFNGKVKQGFTQGKDSSYGHSRQYGFKPMAGITSVAIKTQGSFGTVKKATVEFQVNSLDDLEKFEKLYLLPGYSMLLEWGHTQVLDSNKKDISSNVKTFSRWFENLPLHDPDNDFHRSREILKILDENRTKQFYNYDALLGRVSNFIWSYSNEGTYDCSIDITGYGELTESLSALFQPGVSKKEREKGVLNKFYSYLKLILNSLPTQTSLANQTRIPFDFKRFKAMMDDDTADLIFGQFNNVFAANINSANSEKPSGLTPYKYITLGSLLNFINVNYQLKDSKIPFVKFYTNNHDTKTKRVKYENNNPFITFDSHISYQPDVCILPKPLDLKADIKLDIASSVSVHNCIEGNTDDILNILVNVNYVKTIYSELIKNNKNEDINVYDMVRSLLNSINSSCGNINNFDLHEIDQVYYIVDRKGTPGFNDIDFTLDLVGLKSLSTSIQLSSAIPSNLSTLIAIAASAGGTSLTEDVFSFNDFYKDATDRIIPERTLDLQGIRDLQEKVAEDRKKLLDNLTTVVQFFRVLNTKRVVSTVSTSNLKPAHQAVMNLMLKREIVKKKTNPPGIIPINLSFDILGISGLRITDVFNIGPGLLPSRYKGNVSFTITGIDNKIQSNQWITSISALMMITSEATETVAFTDDISEIISTLPTVPTSELDNENLFPNAAKLRKQIENTPNFREKGFELTSSGNDITAPTANRGIGIMRNISGELKKQGIKDLRFRWTGGHDLFHMANPMPPKSTYHRLGKALDLAIQTDATIEQIKIASDIVFKSVSGMVTLGQIEYLNEYEKPTGHATGGHWHFTFK